MAKRKQQRSIPSVLLITCIITGVATIVIRLLNRRLHIPELAEINSYIGTAFTISLVIMVGIFLLNQVNT